jgi:hypothetical protein
LTVFLVILDADDEALAGTQVVAELHVIPACQFLGADVVLASDGEQGFTGTDLVDFLISIAGFGLVLVARLGDSGFLFFVLGGFVGLTGAIRLGQFDRLGLGGIAVLALLVGLGWRRPPACCRNPPRCCPGLLH